MIKKINSNKILKNNINFLLYKYYKLNLNVFDNKYNWNYINISYLIMVVEKLLFKTEILYEKNFYNELLSLLKYNLYLLIAANSLVEKINTNYLILEYFYIGIDFIVKLELNESSHKTMNYFIKRPFNFKNNKVVFFFLDFYLFILKFLKIIFSTKFFRLVYKFLNKFNWKVLIVKLKLFFRE